MWHRRGGWAAATIVEPAGNGTVDTGGDPRRLRGRRGRRPAMTYRNPVVPGFHPDPSVCCVGNDYFLVASSFTYFPGVPIFHSTNLVDWTQIGNVLDRRSQLDFTATWDWSSLGIYAPTLRHHDGRFLLITTNVGSKGATTFFVTSEDPAGPWSEPVPVPVPGIDPDLAWDGDGNAGSISLDLAASPAAGSTRRAESSSRGPTDVGRDRAAVPRGAAPLRARRHLVPADRRGRHPGRPLRVHRPRAFAPRTLGGGPANPILSHRSTDSPIQNTGHGDLVEAADGSWWMVLLGVRPKGVSPGFHVLGRETFLAPVQWRDGWPVPAELSLDMMAAAGTDQPTQGVAARPRRLRRARAGAVLGRPPPATRPT